MFLQANGETRGLKEQLKAAHKREDELMSRISELRSNLRKAEEGRRSQETQCEDLKRQLLVMSREIESKDENAEEWHKLKIQLDASLSVAQDNLSISSAEIEALKKKVETFYKQRQLTIYKYILTPRLFLSLSYPHSFVVCI